MGSDFKEQTGFKGLKHEMYIYNVKMNKLPACEMVTTDSLVNLFDLIKICACFL